jgi:hypothetical protein
LNLSGKRRFQLKRQKRVNTFVIFSAWSSPGLIESNRGTDDKLFFCFFTARWNALSSPRWFWHRPPKAFGADPPFAKHAKVERVVLNALVNRCGLAA